MRKNLSLPNLVLIITTTVFSFSSMTTAFFMMGSRSLIWFFISAGCYFIPYAIIVAQYTKKYARLSGSIYDWLKDSLSPKTAFVTAFLWYCSYFIWMISLFMKLLIPLSVLLFGQDLTGKIHWLGLPPQVWLVCFSIFAVFLLTGLINRGFQTIVSFLKLSGYAMIGLLLLSLLSNLAIILHQPEQVAANIAESLHAPNFFTDTNEHFLSQLPFFIFSITAFGGLDTVASLADRTKESQTRFPKAVVYSAGLILLLYFSGIILWSGATNLEQLRGGNQMHLGNLMYGLVGSTAHSLSKVLDLNSSQGQLLYQVYIRYTALTMFVSYLSLLSSITYGPLKSLIQGTPKELWPQKLVRLNKQQMPAKALWFQSLLLALCIVALSLNHSFVGDLFNQLTYMTNVSRALPYFIVAMSFPFFLQKGIVQPCELLIHRKSINYSLSLSVCACIFLAIAFQIYEPLKVGNYLNFFTLIIGPLLFGGLASWIYQRLERRQKRSRFA
ncbi:inner membrane transporter YjeM [Enterococcus florum]|uniref:Inner membrane transporter YjeM n=1 Tax=Enterococcus florum TaxID=2480627 RepID=A0A4P5PRI2_9ENTE|nr:amino acid permease [Enterococcus florum]GCF95383.1 inner membrane transporter YjeM [Enterococcus florum]